MLTDLEIREAMQTDELDIQPLDEKSLQPASYDFRIGKEAFVSGGFAKIDLSAVGLLTIDPGEFAVICTFERVHCGPQFAGQIGLDSDYARQGLVLLSGPQIDPGFEGVLVVRVSNLAPRRITLAYGAPFLTVQFFKLTQPVANPYSGSRQGQTGLRPVDIEELSNTDSPTFGGMLKTLTALAGDVGTLSRDVAGLKGSIRTLTWLLPLIVVFGISVMGIIVGLKG